MLIAGLIFDNSLHYLDHLAPFCALAQCPLIICEPELAQIAERFYPDVQIEYISIWDLKLPRYTIACDPQALLSIAFPAQSTQVFWLPHGNSDKGWDTPHFQALDREIALVYGHRMIDFMKEKGVELQTICVGNFRFAYFSKQKTLSAAPNRWLYAPTWDDAAGNNSFWTAYPLLAKHLPSTYELWVKLHPNTWHQFGPELERLQGKYGASNIQFLPNEPPIYPLLAQCSAYIGDMSSIGYDFLAFNRPLYFLNAKQHLPLHQCGPAIDPEHFHFAGVDVFAQKRQELYRYTFEPAPHWKEELYALCRV